MKRIILISVFLLFFLGFALISYAEGGWGLYQPSPAPTIASTHPTYNYPPSYGNYCGGNPTYPMYPPQAPTPAYYPIPTYPAPTPITPTYSPTYDPYAYVPPIQPVTYTDPYETQVLPQNLPPRPYPFVLCKRGYRPNPIQTACEPVPIPPNAHLNIWGNDFECNKGYVRIGDACIFDPYYYY